MVDQCKINSVQAILQKSKYRTGELEIVYKDPKYDVYSFECGDGIWGTSIDLLEGDNYEKIIKEYGEKAIADAEAGEEVPVCVPISSIVSKYTLMNKKGDVIIPSERDLSSMAFEGVITLPDGRQIEPDHPDSPLRKMGLI